MPAQLFALGVAIWQLTRDTVAEWNKDDVPVLGAALAFYTLFSLAPLLIIITVVVGFFLGREAVQSDLLVRLGEYIGPDNAHNLMAVMQHAYRPGSGLLATAIAIGLILFGSTTVFLMLRRALDQMWGLSGSATGWWSLVVDRGKSLLVVMSVGLFIFLAIILKSLLVAFYQTFSALLVVPGGVVTFIDQVLSAFLLTGLFTILYKFLPSARVAWGFAARGALVSAVLFTLGNIFLGLYLTRQTLTSAYGAAGSLVVILLWVYYSAQIIFVGAEFTQVYARRRGQEPGGTAPHLQSGGK